jgi:uncharacterized membrane protein YdjX (TVP38/TMEM64 family)
VFARLEADEVAGRERRTTALAGKLPLPADDVTLEADVAVAVRPHDAGLALDDAPHLGGVEYLAGHRGVGRDHLDPVHRVPERELLVFEVGKQFHAELDPFAYGVCVPVTVASRTCTRITTAHRVGVRIATVVGMSRHHVPIDGAGPQSVWWSGRVFRVMDRATRRQLVGVAGLLGFAGGVALLFSPTAVVAKLESLAARPLLFALVLVGLYLVRPFLLWPVSSVAIALGYLYGPAIAIPLALAGAALTGLPPFLLGRYARTDLGLFGYIGTTGGRLVDTVGETRGVIAARFSPVPGDPISYAAGLSGVSLRSFLAGTVVGEIPWAIVTVFTGASMRTLDPGEFTASPELAVALGGLAILVLAGPLYNKTVTLLDS